MKDPDDDDEDEPENDLIAEEDTQAADEMKEINVYNSCCNYISCC